MLWCIIFPKWKLIHSDFLVFHHISFIRWVTLSISTHPWQLQLVLLLCSSSCLSHTCYTFILQFVFISAHFLFSHSYQDYLYLSSIVLFYFINPAPLLICSLSLPFIRLTISFVMHFIFPSLSSLEFFFTSDFLKVFHIESPTCSKVSYIFINCNCVYLFARWSFSRSFHISILGFL